MDAGLGFIVSIRNLLWRVGHYIFGSDRGIAGMTINLIPPCFERSPTPLAYEQLEVLLFNPPVDLMLEIVLSGGTTWN